MSTTGDGTLDVRQRRHRPPARRRRAVHRRTAPRCRRTPRPRRRTSAGPWSTRRCCGPRRPRRSPSPACGPTLPETVTPVFRDGARGALPVVWNAAAGPEVARPRARCGSRAQATDRARADDPREGGGHRRHDHLDPARPRQDVRRAGSRSCRPRSSASASTAAGPTFRSPGTRRPTGRSTRPGVVDPARRRTGRRRQHGRRDGACAGHRTGARSTPRSTTACPSPPRSPRAATPRSGLRNGNLSEKAWSNWKPGNTKNPSDTITFTLPAARDLNRVVDALPPGRDSAQLPQEPEGAGAGGRRHVGRRERRRRGRDGGHAGDRRPARRRGRRPGCGWS